MYYSEFPFWSNLYHIYCDDYDDYFPSRWSGSRDIPTENEAKTICNILNGVY